mmetsp:Transcript_37440/g.84845  ORF Transcript_37440/g.84845 Transcript_37440/m.84845 type:complete len:208 (+) Transcript_37440:271-894(+)
MRTMQADVCVEHILITHQSSGHADTDAKVGRQHERQHRTQIGMRILGTAQARQRCQSITQRHVGTFKATARARICPITIGDPTWQPARAARTACKHACNPPAMPRRGRRPLPVSCTNGPPRPHANPWEACIQAPTSLDACQLRPKCRNWDGAGMTQGDAQRARWLRGGWKGLVGMMHGRGRMMHGRVRQVGSVRLRMGGRVFRPDME